MLKHLLALCLLLAALGVRAAEPPAQPAAADSVAKGTVLEVLNVEDYAYLRLKTDKGETWAAVAKAPVAKGAKVEIENVSVMTNFHSKQLNRTFPSILFGSLAGAPGAQPSADEMAKAHAGVPKAAEMGDVKVAKAKGANAYTVSEVVTKAAKLKDKTVVVRGKVVKYNPAIMGKNWVHLRDGSGSAADGSNDILVTTADAAKPGDVVTATGIVRTDKDFGSGYAYKVLVEEAKLAP